MIHKKLIVLTGAGISAESGLQTFRDSDGLWEGYRVEEVATYDAWLRNKKVVLNFYNVRRRSVISAQPNTAHIMLAKLEEKFDVHIITQNIDDLHERAGSKQVTHLHGEILKMRSERDAALITPIRGDINLGDTAPDGAQYRPHIVWFGEPVPMISKAASIVAEADLLVVIGTSLVVYPAAGLLQFVPSHTPIFIIDKKIPDYPLRKPCTLLEMSATQGVVELAKILEYPVR